MSFLDYKGLKLHPSPTGTAGIALNSNFTFTADQLESLTITLATKADRILSGSTPGHVAVIDNSGSFSDGGISLGALATQSDLTNLSGQLGDEIGNLTTALASYATTSALTSGLAGKLSSVVLNTPSVIFTSPVSSSTTGGVETLSLALLTQAANKVFAGPTTGANASPTFRSLTATDIPSLATSKITGLDTALANKADTTGTSSGSFTVGTQNDFPMILDSGANISGLTVINQFTGDRADFYAANFNGGTINLIPTAATALTITTGDVSATPVMQVNAAEGVSFALASNGTVTASSFVGAVAATNLTGTIAPARLPVLYSKVASDVTATSTSGQNVTGLSFAIGANETWSIYAVLKTTTNSSVNGSKYAVTIPSGGTVFVAVDGTRTSTTTVKEVITTSGTLTTGLFVVTNSVAGAITISGTVANGSTAGMVQIQFAVSASGSTATVFAGSEITARRMA